MRPTRTGGYVRGFMEEVLQSGTIVAELLDDLLESLPEDAYPGVSHAE